MPLDRLLQGYVRLRADGTSRGRLYDRFYQLHWGNVGTNNYGFAPADAIGPEQYQLQMYKELYKLLVVGGRMPGHADLLEVGCGRGGGLVHLLKLLPGSSAVGLDYSETALRYCREHYRHVRSLAFIRGSAMELPFAEDSFDLLISVEASHNFGGCDGFFREVHRVLRPGGAFLYCDYDMADGVQGIENKMRGAALHGIFHDITSNVAEACRLDSERRRHLIQGCLPWYFRVWVIRYLANYAALEGTRKLEAFRTSRERYYMTCAIKAN